MLFDDKFARTLEMLDLLAKRIAAGKERGEHESTQRGGSVEFADYRAYSSGDELRYVDWNVFARHGQLFLKQFEKESNLHASILLDTSASMAATSPARFDSARRLAASLAYIALASLDTVSFYSFSSSLVEHVRLIHGRKRIFDLLPIVEGLRAEGETTMGKVLEQYRVTPGGHGRELVIVVSDLLDPEGYRRGLLSLTRRKLGVTAVHVCSPSDLLGPGPGATQVLDCESPRSLDTLVTPELASRYEEVVRDFFAEMDTFCSANGINYVRVQDAQPLEEMIVAIVRSGGLLE